MVFYQCCDIDLVRNEILNGIDGGKFYKKFRENSFKITADDAEEVAQIYATWILRDSNRLPKIVIVKDADTYKHFECSTEIVVNVNDVTP